MSLSTKFWKYLFWFLITVVAGEWIYSFWSKFFEKGDFSFLWAFVPLLGASLIAIYKFDKYKWVLAINIFFFVIEYFISADANGFKMDRDFMFLFFIMAVLILAFSFKKYYIIIPTLASVYLLGNVALIFHNTSYIGFPTNFTNVLLILVLLFQSVLSFRYFKKNPKLSMVGFIISILCGIILLGVQLHKDKNIFYFYNNVTLILFLFSFILIMLTVQFSDLTKWTEKEKQFLSLNILIPFFVTFLLICKTELFSSKSYDIFGNTQKYWGMVDYKIEEDRK